MFCFHKLKTKNNLKGTARDSSGHSHIGSKFKLKSLPKSYRNAKSLPYKSQEDSHSICFSSPLPPTAVEALVKFDWGDPK